MPTTVARTAFVLTLSLLSLTAQLSLAQTPSQNVPPPAATDASAAPLAASDAQAPAGQRPETPAAGSAASKPAAPTKASKKAAKKPKLKKEKKPKLVHVKIERGTMTVDGYTGKAALNYDIADLHYLYMYVPGSGTVVVARAKFAGATEQKDAFHGSALTINSAGHVVELVSEKPLLSKKAESAWVKLDPAFSLRSNYPVFGYGDVAAAPYAWPGALHVGQEKGVADAPPLPASVLPALAPKPVPVKLSTAAAPPTAKAEPQPAAPKN